jgi:hypothetical protein
MKVLTLEQAHKFLEKAGAVYVNQDILVSPIVDELQGDTDNNFMYLEWGDDIDGYTTLSFNEGDNQQVAVSGTTMFLYHSEAENEYDNVQISIMSLQQLE